MTSKHYLPSKINSYLRRLQVECAGDGHDLLSEIISAARICVIEETDYDNWNGGTYGHDVKFFLPIEVLGKVKVREQQEIADGIRNDLNICAQAVENEHFRAVSFELDDENDPTYQQAALLSRRPQVNPDALAIWKVGQIRLFISHRDNQKAAATALATALEEYGISAFVAHDTIQPMTTWQYEIVKGLETMEIMLAFITDDFHGSTWTNQEIGFALGRNIPVISLKLQQTDPSGFIGNVQAMKGCLDSPSSSAPDIYKLIADKLGNKERLQSALILAFVQSPDFLEAKVRFDRLAGVVERLSDEEVEQIIRGFRENDQLHNANYLTSKYERLKNFLERCTGKQFVTVGKAISSVVEDAADEVPF